LAGTCKTDIGSILSPTTAESIRKHQILAMATLYQQETTRNILIIKIIP